MNIELTQQAIRQARDSFDRHAGWWNTHGETQNRSPEAMIAAMAEELVDAYVNGCPYCGRQEPMSDFHFHIWGPEWTIVCHHCHHGLEKKPEKAEWNMIKRENNPRLSNPQFVPMLPAPGRPNITGYWEDDAAASIRVHSRH
jgi:hypothetical protein